MTATQLENFLRSFQSRKSRRVSIKLGSAQIVSCMSTTCELPLPHNYIRRLSLDVKIKTATRCAGVQRLSA